MTSAPWVESFTDDELFTITLELMWRIHDECIYLGEPPMHADLPQAIEELETGPWRRVPGGPFQFPWPYLPKCRWLQWMLERLEAASTAPDAAEVIACARHFLIPNPRSLWSLSAARSEMCALADHRNIPGR